MKLVTGMFVLAFVMATHSTVLQANIQIDTSSNSTRLERCSTTLNKYLYLRHNNSSDLILINELEERATVICKGYQVHLEEKDGQLVGVIR